MAEAQSSLPPPTAAQHDSSNPHPIICIMRDQELGKATLTCAVPIALALLKDDVKLKQWEMSLILIALSVGSAAILNGILLKNTFAKSAKVLEPGGIALVFSSFNALMAFHLPADFCWLPAVCICFSLRAHGFIIAACDQIKG